MGLILSTAGAFLLKLFQIVLFLAVFLLLFVIVMICLFLFCPVRYKGAAEYDGNLMAKGKVTWLFSLLSVSFSYQEGKADSKVRIFGINLLKFLEKRQKRNPDSEEQDNTEEKEHQKGKRQKKQPENQPDLQISEIEELDSGDTISGDEAKEPQEPARPGMETGQESQKSARPGTETSEEPQELSQIGMEIGEGQAEKSGFVAFFRRIREWPRLLWRKVQGFLKTLRQIFATIKGKAEWAGQIREFWKSENTQGMVCILKDNVVHLLRKIKPKVLRGTVFFGTGDPCMTGRILGVAAILYAAYGKGIQVVPDFEEARLEGKLYARGRLSMITVALLAIRIFRSKEWKQFRYGLDQLKDAL